MDEKTKQLSDQFIERSEKLRGELLEIEKSFNAKKEEYLKIQGALEAIQFLSQD
jgi:hypothetical protein